MSRESHYQSSLPHFVLHREPDPIAWRKPQLGALGAVIGRWSVDPTEPLLVSLPTGAGKSGVATALPYLAQAHRVLVVVPSSELRTQLAESFRNESVLRNIGALVGSMHPIVEQVKGRRINWTALKSADVIVAHPNSISPSHFEPGTGPDPDFFDLIILDEAHHAPAKTWRAIIDYYPNAKIVLLTATPRRADGKNLPGVHAFHYPLRLAMADGIFHPIDPVIIPVDENSTIGERDRRLANEVVTIMATPVHMTSAALIRAKTVARAGQLRALYAELGLNAEVMSSTVSATDRERILTKWKNGDIRAVITVDMLAEGFDMPSLRVVGYHDKHKSVPATMQFIGRLARTALEFPQSSVLVTVKDQEIYPALEGALKELYEIDADWADLLPGFIDEPVRAKQEESEYIGAFKSAPPGLSLSAIHPLARALIFEVPDGSDLLPRFQDDVTPEELRVGATFASQVVVYSGLNSTFTQLLVLTSRQEQPRWYEEDDLTRAVYGLHVISWHRSQQVDKRHLLFINSQEKRTASALRELLDPNNELRNADPAKLQLAFDSLERYSVSSIGVRNTFAATPGTPAYAMFAGSGVERGLREADTNSRALGHAMAQVQPAEGGSATNAGMAASKSKYWETRYLSLLAYERFTNELAGRYWFPRATASGPLLPDLARAVRTERFPDSLVIHVELDPRLFGAGWVTTDNIPLESLELQIDESRPSTNSTVYMRMINPTDEAVIWTGSQDIDGRFTTVSETETFTRGRGLHETSAELLAAAPPTIYFLDGHAVYGGVTYLPPEPGTALPTIEYTRADWAGVDIQRETRRQGRTDSIHEWVESRLAGAPLPTGVERWVLLNDGKGEIADHIVLEIEAGRRPRIELWHSKASEGSTPAARVKDMQVVTQQAAKSRRYITDRKLWSRLLRRLGHAESPPIVIIAGDATRLQEVLAELDAQPQAVDARIVLVQPGLSFGRVETDLAAGVLAATQVREFLVFLANAVGGLGRVEAVISD